MSRVGPRRIDAISSASAPMTGSCKKRARAPSGETVRASASRSRASADLPLRSSAIPHAARWPALVRHQAALGSISGSIVSDRPSARVARRIPRLALFESKAQTTASPTVPVPTSKTNAIAGSQPSANGIVHPWGVSASVGSIAR